MNLTLTSSQTLIGTLETIEPALALIVEKTTKVIPKQLCIRLILRQVAEMDIWNHRAETQRAMNPGFKGDNETIVSQEPLASGGE